MKDQNTIPERTGRAQVITCHCGNTFAICIEPECYTDADWQRDMRKYVKGGCTVQTVTTEEAKELFGLGSCKCDKTGKKSKAIKNQSTLF